MATRTAEEALRFVGKGMLGTVLVLTCLAAGCVTIAVPEDALNRADRAISKAATAGAGQYAATQINQARKSLATARELSQTNDNLQSRYSAQSAQAYAELAQALAQAERADQRADKAENELARVRNQIKQQQDATP